MGRMYNYCNNYCNMALEKRQTTKKVRALQRLRRLPRARGNPLRAPLLVLCANIARVLGEDVGDGL